MTRGSEPHDSVGGPRVAILAKELRDGSGQTVNVLEILAYLEEAHPDVSVTIFVNKQLFTGKLPTNANLVVLDRYYSCLLGWQSLSHRLCNFDVAYVQGNFPYLIPVVKSGIPSMLVVHQRDSPCYSHSLTTKLQVIASNIMLPYVLEKATVVCTVSDELIAYYRKKYGISATLLTDAVDSGYYAASRQRRDCKPPLKLLSVGPWDGKGGRKRQDQLIRVFADAQGKFLPSTLTLAGLTQSALTELRDLAEALGVGQAVTFLGYRSRDELIEQYMASHIYVTATTFEGFYRQVIEAFAAGMPAVVFDSRTVAKDWSQAGAANHVLKSQGGELFTDSQSFALAINRVCSDYSGYSARAFQYAQQFQSSIVGEAAYRIVMSTSSLKPKQFQR